jgi:hypothetical protein
MNYDDPKFWKRAYLVVLVNLALMVAAFYWFTKAFE